MNSSNNILLLLLFRVYSFFIQLAGTITNGDAFVRFSQCMNAVRCALKVGSFYAGLYAVLIIISNLFIINRRIAFVTKKVERLAISKCITPVRGSCNGIIHRHDFLLGWLIHVLLSVCAHLLTLALSIHYICILLLLWWCYIIIVVV